MLSKDVSGRITVSFPYAPQLVEKVKTIDGRKWHKDKKYWSFPDTDGTLKKILKVFEGEEIKLDPPTLQDKLPTPVIARSKIPRLSSREVKPPHLSLRGTKSRSNLITGVEQVSQSNFEDLRRELVSRRYSYKTVKGYIYYNKDLLNFARKSPVDINESNIKDYLYYLAEERRSATSTLNQAINALKFYPALLQRCGVYYGTMLKKKFVYEVKRPRKDKKLPVVLSKEKVAKIINSVDNLKHKTLLMLVYPALFSERLRLCITFI